MRLLCIGVVSSLVAGVACKPKKTGSIECADQVAKLRVWLDGLWTDGFGVSKLPSAPSLVAVDVDTSVVELDRSVVIELRRDEAMVQGARYELDNADAVLEMNDILATEWEQSREYERTYRRPAPDAINLVAQRSTPWRAIRTAIDAASAAGWPRAAFVVGIPWTSGAPGPSPLDPEIAAKKSPQEPASPLGETLQRRGPSPLARKAFAGCPAAIERMETIDEKLEAFEQPELEQRFKQHLLVDLPDALVQCNCGADLASVRALYWMIFGRATDLRPMAVTVDLAPARQPATEIAAPDATPWSRTHQQIVKAAAAGKPVRLTAAEPRSRP